MSKLEPSQGGWPVGSLGSRNDFGMHHALKRTPGLNGRTKVKGELHATRGLEQGQPHKERDILLLCFNQIETN